MATEAERNRGLGAYSTPGVDKQPDLSPAAIITSSPQVVFRLQGVDPPSRVYVTENDFLSFLFRSSTATTTLIIRTRILRKDGTITYSEDNFVGPTDRSSSVFFVRLTEGYLLGVQVSNGGPSNVRGQTFIQGLVAHGQLTPTKSFQPLFSGYLLPGNILGWPGGIMQAGVDGPGWGRVVLGTIPAAGAEINEVVPTGARWRLRSMVFSLTTGAAVANRESQLFMLDASGNTFFGTPSGFSQAASVARNYEWPLGSTRFDGAVAARTVSPLCDGILMAGYKIVTVTQNLQAADQYGQPQYEVEEWIEN